METCYIVRGDVAYIGHQPEDVIRGNAREWPKLQNLLEKTQKSSSSSKHPSGFLAGFFAYDGSFEFSLYQDYQVVPLPEKKIQLIKKKTGLWQEHINQAFYMQMVSQAKEYIKAGDIYQVNLARRSSTKTENFDPWKFFQILFAGTSAPQSMFYRGTDCTLMSASPELFLEIQGNHICTRPIKGTRPRYASTEADKQSIETLLTSTKERAELIMITDLERNDLGQVCVYDSVQVTELAQPYTFSHVHHLVSTIEGKLRPDITPLEAIHACFPGGSITGAPKKRAMEIIEELEPCPRGIYTGAMGYLGLDGSVYLNIGIRTAEWRNNELSFFTGSGITADSDPLEEYHETNHKATALIEAYETYLHSAL